MGYQKIRKQALERDGYTCQDCGTSEELHVHHIVSREDNGSDDLSNLKTLCRTCHEKFHMDEINYYKALYRRGNLGEPIPPEAYGTLEIKKRR